MKQGEVWWADLPAPEGSEPGFRRPMIVVQSDAFNRSSIRTVICVAVTSNLPLGEAPGNVFLPARESGLPKDSIADVSRVVTIDRGRLTERAGHLADWLPEEIFQGVDQALGREI